MSGYARPESVNLRSCCRQLACLLWLACLFVAPAQPVAGVDLPNFFTTFESAQVRPLALSPDGSRLFALNTPDGRLEVFDVHANGIELAASLPVGLEPVAVAARSNDEVWVVNHLSDSVSIVALEDGEPWRVIRTLHVGDEPNDIVFAGSNHNRAFITTAHRGQNSPFPRSEYATPGVGRADVWVFDADALGSSMGGEPLKVLTLFGDKPRPLAVSPDGSRVYAGVFHSGNQTTTINEMGVCDGGSNAGPCSVGGINFPGGLPGPNMNAAGKLGPETGLIVRFEPDHGEWRDELGRNWNQAVRFNLPDFDVFEIDADAATPVQQAAYSSVGTILFNMAVNPVSGKVYVSNTEAHNEVRFEGPGVLASDPVFGKTGSDPLSVRGHLHEARITVLDGGNVLPRHLNKHIDYDAVPTPAGVKERSLATPLEMAISSDGTTLYLAAFGSSKIGVFSTQALENDSFVPSASDHIELTGGGPTGIVLDEARDQLYVLTRFDNTVSVVGLSSWNELQRVPLRNPEPKRVVDGRPFLYDATLTSSNGEASCSSCHVFGDMDDLAWDLGNPDGDVVANPNPASIGSTLSGTFHPLKGPMTTQTLRGMAHHGAMHWRGDKTGGHTPGGDSSDEVLAFKAFNGAFDGVLGRDEGPLSEAQIQAFADFALELTPPPNPIRQLDGSLRTDEARGSGVYFGFGCDDCHTIDPQNGLFGSNGTSTTSPILKQDFKTPQLRNLYQRVGMFGMAEPGSAAHLGDQVRGFGFLHDGSVDTAFRFLNPIVFSLNTSQRQDVEAFLMAFPSNLAPMVGQQVTLDGDNESSVDARIDLMIARAGVRLGRPRHSMARECELVVHGLERSWLYDHTQHKFVSDRAAEAPLSDSALRQLAAPDRELTYSCMPPGAGIRAALDADGDGVWNRDELDAGSDPRNAGSTPSACRDGIDNNGDGLIDSADAGCKDDDWMFENPACSDGVDNDGDGLIDASGVADPQCQGDAWRTYEGEAACAPDFECRLAKELFVLQPGTAVASNALTQVRWSDVVGAASYEVFFSWTEVTEWHSVAGGIQATRYDWHVPKACSAKPFGRVKVVARDALGNQLEQAESGAFTIEKFVKPVKISKKKAKKKKSKKKKSKKKKSKKKKSKKKKSKKKKKAKPPTCNEPSF